MPRARIVVADSISSRHLRAVYPFDRVAVIEPTDREHLGNARVIGASGGVVTHRSGGIAVLVARTADVARVMEAIAQIPDPVLVVAHSGPAPTEVAAALEQRAGGCLVQVGPGLIACAVLDATNEPGKAQAVEVGVIRAPRPRPRRKDSA